MLAKFGAGRTRSEHVSVLVQRPPFPPLYPLYPFIGNTVLADTCNLKWSGALDQRLKLIWVKPVSANKKWSVVHDSIAH